MFASKDVYHEKHESSPSLDYSSRVSVTSRRRSHDFYLARDALSRVADCGRKTLDLHWIQVHFENWMEKYRGGKFVRLIKDDQCLFIRCINRFMEPYKRKLWKKMRLLQYIEWDLKIDLTVDPKRFMRLEDELIFIGKAWAKLRAWLRKRYGKFEFLCVFQAQKSGRPHLHVLISGFPYVSHEDLSKIWRKYGGGYVWVRSTGSTMNELWYVLKYVNKTILGKNKIYASVLFASNKRMFSMSQNLMSLLNVKRHPRESGWTFAGVVDEHIVEQFCLEENVPYNDIIRIDVTTELLYKYQVLFDVSEDESAWTVIKDG